MPNKDFKDRADKVENIQKLRSEYSALEQKRDDLYIKMVNKEKQRDIVCVDPTDIDVIISFREYLNDGEGITICGTYFSCSDILEKLSPRAFNMNLNYYATDTYNVESTIEYKRLNDEYVEIEDQYTNVDEDLDSKEQELTDAKEELK